jgi:phage-related protein
MGKVRTVLTYKEYTSKFLDRQPKKVRDKFIWTFQLIEEIEIIPTTYLKHVEDGIYEVRVKLGSNIYRVMAFFDDNKLVLTINGFQKKTQKTPKSDITRAKKIRQEYEKEKS